MITVDEIKVIKTTTTLFGWLIKSFTFNNIIGAMKRRTMTELRREIRNLYVMSK